MAEVSRRSHIILIHEIVKYHISRTDKKLLLNLKDTPEGSFQNDTHSSINESLDQHGYHLGSRIVSRLTLSRGRIWDPNKCMVFICRDLWIYLFGKQAKRLQSNSQGVYIIFSDELYWLENLQFNFSNVDELPNDYPSFHDYRSFYLSLISGVIRGCLKSLGFSCSVTGEHDRPCMSLYPIYTFTFR